MISSATNKRAGVRHRFGAGGFTLIELLSVIVIMALIAAIGFPALKAMSGTALATGARQFSNALILARQYAITNRTRVRLALAVDPASAGGASSSNLILRAYSVYWRSNDVNGAEVAWWPLQDWRTLPSGVVFSDHNWDSYAVATLKPISAGASVRNFGTGTSTTTWQFFNTNGVMNIVTNIATGMFVAGRTNSCIEFLPTGTTTKFAGSSGFGGVRLALGAVTIPPSRTVVINDTNNWVYVEYDGFGGRVRTRYPDTW